MEIWKTVIGYENYEVSSLGRIKRMPGVQAKIEREIVAINNGNNYMGVSLCQNSKARRMYVHRIVATAFLDNPDNKAEVNHIDGNRQNNRLDNLEWVTRSENHHHRYKILKQDGVNKGKTGAKNWKSKPVNMFDMQGNLVKSFPGVCEAGRQIGVNEASIRSAIYGKRATCKGHLWAYVT